MYHPPAGERGAGSELRHLLHAAKAKRICSLILTMCVVWDHKGICRPSTYIFQEISGHWRQNKGHLGFFSQLMQQTISALAFWFVTYHKWRTPAGVSWCRGSRGPQRFEYLPALNSLCGRDTCGTPSSELKATNTLQYIRYYKMKIIIIGFISCSAFFWSDINIKDFDWTHGTKGNNCYGYPELIFWSAN